MKKSKKRVGYDSSWDEDNDELWDEMYEKWEAREWQEWLLEEIEFPIHVERFEDMNDDFFGSHEETPFSVGRKFNVTNIVGEDEEMGIIVEVVAGKSKGHVPLSEVEVTDKNNKNYWPIREYAVWMANR